MTLLVQFLFRLTSGLALAMWATPPRFVPSGFYRVHSYVLLGAMALASLIAVSSRGQLSLVWPLSAAVLSYLASVVWLYEAPRVGRSALVAVALLALCGAWQAADAALSARKTIEKPPSTTPLPASTSASPAAGLLSPTRWLERLEPVTSALLLGFTLAAMLLGHWYLNSPGMQLEPLRRLVAAMAASVVLRSLVVAAGWFCEIRAFGWPASDWGTIGLWGLRVLGGLVMTLAMAVMSWQTLKIPNTQSATGILYVGVISAFVGELAAQLLSAQYHFPV